MVLRDGSSTADGVPIAIKGLPIEQPTREETTSPLQQINQELAIAFQDRKTEKIAELFDLLFTHIKGEGKERFRVEKTSTASARAEANTFSEWSSKLPQIDEQSASFLLVGPRTIVSNTLDKDNQHHGANSHFRGDTSVIAESLATSSAVVKFLEQFESPFFSVAVGDELATRMKSPHSVRTSLGRKAQPIQLDGF